MFPNNCHAFLMSDRGKILDHGIASIFIKDKFIVFKSGFVPLLQFGAAVRIVCAENGQQTHIFSGDVFISTHKFMKIVSINCTLLPDAEKALYIDTAVKGKVSVPALTVKPKFRLTNAPCVVTSISMKRLCFKSPPLDFDWHIPFNIELKDPIFQRRTQITVKASRRNISFGKIAKYECDIHEINRNTADTLMEYIREKNLEILTELIGSQ
ncbi:MAG: hypothetical protein LBR54_04625 [Oscillospiraceae bacterium]|jgi:hypothetical protein|nr:hypothetical protein [Oscillospiraceae bacterium]